MLRATLTFLIRLLYILKIRFNDSLCAKPIHISKLADVYKLSMLA